MALEVEDFLSLVKVSLACIGMLFIDENKAIFGLCHTQLVDFVERTITDSIVEKGSLINYHRLLQCSPKFSKARICGIHVFLGVISYTMHL